MSWQQFLRVLCWLAGAAAGPALAEPARDGVVPAAFLETVEQFVGNYQGTWNTELTDDPVDDLSRHDLSSWVMRLALDDAGRLSLAFLEPGKSEPLDLLGFGCRSSVGPLLDVGAVREADQPATLELVFDFDWGRCPARVHAVATTKLQLELVADVAERTAVARLTLLRKVQGDYRVFAKVDGKRRPVNVRRRPGAGSLYNPELEYCILDELGEETCVEQRTESRVAGAPLPAPGATVFWWQAKKPGLVVEKGKRLLFHEGVFSRPL